MNVSPFRIERMWQTRRTEWRPGYTVYVNAVKSTTGAYYYAQPGLATDVYGEDSLIEDLYTVDGKDRRTFRPCQHYKMTRQALLRTLPGCSGSWVNTSNHSAGVWNPTPLPTGWLWNGGRHGGGTDSPVATFGNWSNPLGGLPVLYRNDALAHAVMPGVNVTDLVARSLQNMLPGIRNNLSLPNSLYELKDFKSLPVTINRAYKFLRDLGSSLAYSSSGKNIAKWSLRRLTRTGADGYLQAQFNILPLLSDISALRGIIDRSLRNLRWLQTNSGKVLYTHFQCGLGDSYMNSVAESEQATGIYFVDPLFRARRDVVYNTARFNATLEYQFLFQNVSGLSDELAALADAVGFNLNPAILWNAIPWSFVIDWLVRVNAWLDQWKLRNIEPVTYVRQYCWSVKVERSTLLYLGYLSTAPVSRITETAYIRQPSIADFTRGLQTSGLSLKELSLGAALVFSRV